MSEEDMQKRTLEKLPSGEFKLTVVHEKDKWLQQKTYTKEELKTNYKTIRLQVDQLRHAIAEGRKNIKGLPEKFTEEEEKIAATLAKAQKLHEKNKLLEQLRVQEVDFEQFSKQLREIELVVPEVKRV